jgi:hypothetical protein
VERDRVRADEQLAGCLLVRQSVGHEAGRRQLGASQALPARRAAREVTVIDLDHAYLGVGLTIDLADEHLH